MRTATVTLRSDKHLVTLEELSAQHWLVSLDGRELGDIASYDGVRDTPIKGTRVKNRRSAVLWSARAEGGRTSWGNRSRPDAIRVLLLAAGL